MRVDEARLVDDEARDGIAERGANAPSRSRGPERQIVVAGSLGQIGDDDGKQSAEQAGADAIEQLDRDEVVRIVPERIKQRADRKDGESDKKKRFAPEDVALGADAASPSEPLRFAPL